MKNRVFRTTKIMRSVLVLVATAIFILSLCSCGILNAASSAQSYDFGNDKVPSITSVVGERKTSGVKTGTSNGVQYREIQYDSDDPIGDIQDYIDYLQEKGWVITEISGSGGSGTVQIGTESSESGKIILVTINYKSSSYELKAEKMEGELNRY